MVIYSPSETKTWDFCPTKRNLDKAGWRPRLAGNKDVAAMVGTALAAGFEALNKSASISTASTHAIKTYALELAHLQQWGVVFKAKDLVGQEDLINVSLVKYHTHTFPAQAPIKEILAVEESLPRPGLAHDDPHYIGQPDLVITDIDGNLAVCDYKCKMKLDPQYYEKEVDSYKDDWQLHHYSWGWWKKTGNIPKLYYIILVVLKPHFSVKFHGFPLRDLAVWEKNALTVWGCMHDEEKLSIVRESTIHKDKYGKCEMYDGCLVMDRDPKKMALQYVKVPRFVHIPFNGSL